MSFWGIRVSNEKNEKFVVQKAFKISTISLDIDTIDECSFRSVWVESKGKHMLLGSVSYNIPQIVTDIAFAQNEEVDFYVKGQNAMIYLCGYEIEDVFDDESHTQMKKKRKISDIKDEKNESTILKPNGSVLNLATEFSKRSEQNLSTTGKNPFGIGLPSVTLQKESGNPFQVNKFGFNANSTDFFSPKKNENLDLKNADVVEKAESEHSGDDNMQSSTGKFKALGKGVEVVDLVVGKGDTVKERDVVKVTYSASMVGEERVLIATPTGLPTTISLSKRDVIVGFKMGIVGMKVGGVRQIKCAAKAAYGAKGFPPFIPANTDIVFDIILVEIEN